MREDSCMCKWGDDILLDYVQGRLPATLTAEIAQHVPTCASCKQTVDDLGGLAALSAAPRIEPGPELYQAILDAQKPPRRAGKPGTRRIRFLRGGADRPAVAVIWAAAAALFMVVLFLAFQDDRAPRKPSDMVVVTPELKPALPPREIVPPAPPPVTPPLPPPQERPRPTVEPPRPTPLPAPKPEPEPVKPPPQPAPAPPPTRVAEAVEFGRVLQIAGRAERGGKPLAKGDAVMSGDVVTCAAGTLLIQTGDASLVAMRAGSKGTLKRDGDHVLLPLAEGEVVCTVSPRPQRRFVVETGHGTVTVTGTIFSVRTGPASAVATVARGGVDVKTEAGTQKVGAGQRASMSRSSLPRVEPVNAERALGWATEAGMHISANLWILAATGEFQAPMTRGKLYAAGSISGEPIFAAVDSRTLPSWNGRFLAAGATEGGHVTFSIDIPEAGPWHVWGRFFHPSSGTTLWKMDTEPKENDPNSFYLSVDGGKEAVFGNHKSDPETKTSWYRRWHWGGDGTIEAGRPAGLSLGTLAKGRHTIRIRNRDAVETASQRLAPRLDVLCLTQDPNYRPRDEDFRR